MATLRDEEALEKVAKEFYGPVIKATIQTIATQLGFLQQRLDTLERERLVVAATIKTTHETLTRLMSF